MSTKTAPFISVHTFIVLLLLLIGIALRVGNPYELTFINDELSTWQKISFDTVGQLIENIKVDDAHPVGMYVFLYYWTAIFGTAQWAFKLPFIIMSVASMGLVYQIGRDWFNRTAALILLAYFATLQYPIWWATIARQYQSGLFCTLLMVYFWTQLLILKRDKKGYWIGFVFAGAAAMYNHYFSLIFAAVVGLVGFLWISKRLLLRYLLAGMSMMVLFLPHWSVTYSHLTVTHGYIIHAEGHSWYTAPDSSFIINHFRYLFHYDFVCLGLALLLSLGSLLYYDKQVLVGHWRQRLTAILLFSIPLLFGFFYSIYQSPILRESHLLFSFPYLLLLLFSFFPEKVSHLIKAILVVLVVVVNVSTLVVTRRHFETINSHPYDTFVVHTKAFLEERDSSQVMIILGENPLYLQYFKDKYQTKFEHHHSYPSIPMPLFKQLLEQEKPYLIVGSLSDAQTSMALDHYPYTVQYEQGINFEYYILSKQPISSVSTFGTYTHQTASNFEKDAVEENWDWKREAVQWDSSTNNAYYTIPEGEEWSFRHTGILTHFADRASFLEMQLKIRTDDTPANGTLVLEIYDPAGKQIAWFGEQIQTQITHSPQQWQTIYASMRLAHYIKTPTIPEGATFLFYYWNKHKQAVVLDDIKIQARQGNPILYKDTNPF